MTTPPPGFSCMDAHTHLHPMPAYQKIFRAAAARLLDR
jgi:hypothetical protein